MEVGLKDISVELNKMCRCTKSGSNGMYFIFEIVHLTGKTEDVKEVTKY